MRLSFPIFKMMPHNIFSTICCQQGNRGRVCSAVADTAPPDGLVRDYVKSPARHPLAATQLLCYNTLQQQEEEKGAEWETARGCWAGNQSCIVPYQASWRRCVCSRSAILSVTCLNKSLEWFSSNLKGNKLHSVALTLRAEPAASVTNCTNLKLINRKFF